MASAELTPGLQAAGQDGANHPLAGMIPIAPAERCCSEEIEALLKDYSSVIEDVIAPSFQKDRITYWSSWPYNKIPHKQVGKVHTVQQNKSFSNEKFHHFLTKTEELVEANLSLRLNVWGALVSILLHGITLVVSESWTLVSTPAEILFTVLAWTSLGLVSCMVLVSFLKPSLLFHQNFTLVCLLLFLATDISLIVKFCTHRENLTSSDLWVIEILLIRGICQVPILQHSHLAMNWVRGAVSDLGMFLILATHWNYHSSNANEKLPLPISVLICASLTSMVSQRSEILTRKRFSAAVQRLAEKAVLFLSVVGSLNGCMPLFIGKFSYIPKKEHHPAAVPKFTRTRVFKSRSNIAGEPHTQDPHLGQVETPVFEMRDGSGFSGLASFKPAEIKNLTPISKPKRNFKWIPASRPGTNVEDLPVSPISYGQELESTRRGLESSRNQRESQNTVFMNSIAQSRASGVDQVQPNPVEESVSSPEFRGSFQTFSFARQSQLPSLQLKPNLGKKKPNPVPKLEQVYISETSAISLYANGTQYRQAAKLDHSHPVLDAILTELAACPQQPPITMKVFTELLCSRPIAEAFSKSWSTLTACNIVVEGLKGEDAINTPKSKVEQFSLIPTAKKRGSKNLAQSEVQDSVQDLLVSWQDLVFTVFILYNKSEAAWQAFGSFMTKPGSKFMLPLGPSVSIPDDSSTPQDESIMQQTFAKSNMFTGEDMEIHSQVKSSKFMTPQLSTGSKFQQRSSIMKLRRKSNTGDDTNKQVQFVDDKKQDTSYNASRMSPKVLLGKSDSSSSDDSSLKSGHRNQQEAQASAYEDIVAVVVHDMRSPLGCILGNLQLIDFEIQEHIHSTSLGQSMMSSASPQSVGSLYHLISPLIKASIAATSLLETLVNDMLDAARISKGIFRVIAEDISLKQTLEECLQTLQIAAKSKHLSLLLHYTGKEHIYSDKQRIKQVVLNFLTNAIKFTPISGRIDIFATAASAEQNRLSNSDNDSRERRETVKIEVRDNGEGIKPEMLDKLFQKFNSNRDSKSNAKGLGLGLFICKSIVETLGPKGNIKVHSQVGQGTTISFELYSEVQPRPEFENESFKILRVQDSMGDIPEPSVKEPHKQGPETSILRKDNKQDSGNPRIGTGVSNITMSPRNRPRFETSVIHFKPGITSSTPGFQPGYNKSITNESKLFGKSELDSSKPRMEDIFKLNDAGAQISKRIIEVRRRTVRMTRVASQHKTVLASTFLRTSTNTQKQLEPEAKENPSPKSFGHVQAEPPRKSIKDSPNSIFFEVNDSAMASEVRPLHILLVEDEPALMDVYEHYCDRFKSKYGKEFVVEFLHACSIEDGKRVLSQIAVDVVVTDYSLPDGTGLNLAQEQLPVHFERPLFVLASGERTFPPQIHAEIKVKFFKVLEKPVALKVWMDMLLTCIQQVKSKEVDASAERLAPVRAISLMNPAANE